MREIGAFEAKNTLGSLLDDVQKGEEIVITRHGKPVARLIPESGRTDLTRTRKAAADIRQLAKRARLGAFDWDEWKGYRRPQMSIVIDSSLALAWLHTDEDAPGADALIDMVAERGAIAPSLWFLEVANALTASMRRKRISRTQRNSFLRALSNLDIQCDDETAAHAWTATQELADIYGLTVYDAAYLELAQRRRLPLATLDRQLRKAAESAGVQALPA